MSRFYNPKKERNLFDPKSRKPFRISRSKIDLFVECPRCFYRDRKLGVGRPPGFPFALNSAVDALLKKEFDIYRKKKSPHPIMVENNVRAIPFQHPDLEKWRTNFTGVQYLHPPSNFLVTGAIDDVWVDPEGTLIVVDYKATSKAAGVGIDEDWQDGYKRQMEIYQWLLRQNGFKVSDTGYFLYCNGLTTPDKFDKNLTFDISLLPYKGSGKWIEKTLFDIQKCLWQDVPPRASEECDYCNYLNAVSEVETHGY